MRTKTEKATAAMQEKYRLIREQAYQDGLSLFESRRDDRRFRDFLVIYLCEGYKRSRNMIGITNGDPAIIDICYPVVKSFLNVSKISFSLQIHHDDNETKIIDFWATRLGVSHSEIKTYLRKEKKTIRKGKLEYGILTFRVGDTKLRAKLQACLDQMKEQWKC